MAKTDKTWAWHSYKDKRERCFDQGAGRELYGGTVVNDAILHRTLTYELDLDEVDTFTCCPLSTRVLEYQSWYLIFGLNQGIMVYDMPEDMTEYSYSNRCGLPDEISHTYCPKIGVSYRD